MALARQLDAPKPVEHVKNNVQNPTGPYLLTSEGQCGTYRLLLQPPRELPPWIDAEIKDCCDRLFDGLDEKERAFLLARLVEEMGVQVDG
jgi:hypothetical protein